MRQARHWTAGFSAMLLGVSVIVISTTAVEGAGAAEGDFADFLISQQLVLDGTVTAIDTVTRVLPGGCGLPQRQWGRTLDLHVRVDQVRVGVADDATVVITTGAVLSYPRQALRVGSSVLVWAYRNCGDGWRLWGGAAVKGSSGHLIQSNSYGSENRLTGQAAGSPMTLSSLNQALGARSTQTSTQAFEGVPAVALARVVSVEHLDGVLRCNVDSVRVVIGEYSNLPTLVDFTLPPSCFDDVVAGDWLLVPLPGSPSGQSVTLAVCPYSFVVRAGFARGLGVPVTFIGYALSSSAQGLHLKPFISKD